MATIPDQRDGIEAKEKLDGYLMRSGLASRAPRVVPRRHWRSSWALQPAPKHKALQAPLPSPPALPR